MILPIKCDEHDTKKISINWLTMHVKGIYRALWGLHEYCIHDIQLQGESINLQKMCWLKIKKVEQILLI